MAPGLYPGVSLRAALSATYLVFTEQMTTDEKHDFDVSIGMVEPEPVIVPDGPVAREDPVAQQILRDFGESVYAA